MLDDMEQRVTMLKTQLVEVKEELAELKNISEDITAIQEETGFNQNQIERLYSR